MGAIIIFPIIFVTETDYESYKEFCKFMTFKRRGYKAYRYLFFIPFILMIPMGIVAIILDINVVLPTFLFFFAAAAFLHFGYSFFVAPRSLYKKMPSFTRSPLHYEIYEDRFVVNHSDPDSKGNVEIKYSMLSKAYETRDAFYLSITKISGYLIPKKYLTDEQINQLSDLFSSRLEPDKYKVCYKKQIRDKKN